MGGMGTNNRGGGNRSGNGGGGSGGRTSGSTSNQLPSYVSGAYNNLINRSLDASKQKYKAFPKSPLAAEDPMVGQASSMLNSYVNSNWDQGYDDASGIYGGIDQRAKQLQNFQGNGVNYSGPGAFASHDYNAQTVNPWDVSSQQIDANPWNVSADQVTADQWGADKAQQYMSPYLTQVLDAQKNRAELDFRRAQPSRNDAAIQSGAFGGSRHGVVDALGQEAHLRNMSEIDATGMNNAWSQALQAFGGDRDAALQAMMSNQGANLSAAQGNQNTMFGAAKANQDAALSASQGNQNFRLQSGIANQNSNLEAQRLSDASNQYGYTQSMTQADRRMEAQRLSEEFRQGGANIALDALGQRNQAAQGIAGLTTDRANQTTTMADNLNRYGLQATARDQALRDYQMQKFQDKRNNKKNNLNWMSGILNGVPVNTDTTQTSYVNPYSQALGLATAGLGAYQTFKGSGTA